MYRRQPALMIFTLLLSICSFADTASAQGFPCGGGPGPGQRQIGVAGGTGGIAAYPICVNVDQEPPAQAEPKRPLAPTIMVDNFVAVAGHPKQRDVWATWGQYYLGASEKVVLDACEKSMGTGCYLMVSGMNMSVAAGIDKKGNTHAAYGASTGKAKSALLALCETRKQSCSVIGVFDAQSREEPIEAAALLRDDFDKSGLFKSYHFPEGSAMSPPQPGKPDAGYGAMTQQDQVMQNLVMKIKLDRVKIVHYSASGVWLLKQEDKKGLGCSLAYVSGSQRMIFFGPTREKNYGAIMIAGSLVPPAIGTEPRRVSATLTDLNGTQNIPLLHGPTGAANDGMLLIAVDIGQTIAGFTELAANKLVFEGKTVLDVQIEGGIKAKNAMLQCLAGK